MNGRLIVFEGTDGSGKATQTELLCRYLQQRQIPFRKLTFPRYDQLSSALIRLYLDGAFGDKPDAVNAYAAASFFAMDRYASFQQDWGDFYRAGGLLVADRYTTSNAVHQTVKLPPAERDAFLDWLFDYEYRLLGLPSPDRVLYLDMPTELTEQMMRRREKDTHTHADIHEQDTAYLRQCRDNAAYVTRRCGWTRIECAEGGAIRTVEEIHREVLRHLSDLLPQ
ncbi:MAG: thymidylate kinase [Oscillospiraceae bacterium]|nr:thymidylate kinase [Oscillospiraceae bacterium]